MDVKLLVVLILLLSSVLTIILVLKKPRMKVSVKSREYHIDTFFIGALLGFFLIIICGLLSYDQLITGLTGEGGFNPLGVLILFFSMVFISIFLDTTGFFEYCARVALKYAGNSGKRLFFSMYAIVSLLTIFTSNDIVILTFTPFIYYFTKSAGVDPKPYLISEFFAANTWSMMLYIGNPTNIMLASAFSINFDEYLRWMFFPTLAAGLTSIIIIYLIFKNQINVSIKLNEIITPKDALVDKKGALIGLILLAGCIITLVIAPYFGIEMWFVSLSCALFLLIVLIIRDLYKSHANKDYNNAPRYSLSQTLKKMPWGIIPFVLSLFIIIEALNVYEITTILSVMFNSLVGTSTIVTIFLFGFLSAFSANILNNIPMTVSFVPIILRTTQETAHSAMYATVIGSNLGANITPIGALAGIMWMNILHEKEYELSFWSFVKYGLLITPLTLVSCLGVLSLEFIFF